MTTVTKQQDQLIGDEDFVKSLYRALLDREPDSEGLKAHLSALGAGLTRDELRDSFLVSHEYAERRSALTGLSPRVLHALSPHPIWWLDNIAKGADDDSVTVTGWALGHRDYLALAELTLNGARAATFTRQRASDLVARLPWFRGNAQRFTATFNSVQWDAQTGLRFSFVRGEVLEPFSRWQDIHFPLDVWQQQSHKSPDRERLLRGEGSESAFQFVMVSDTMAHTLAEAVQTYFGRQISEYHSICDLGCGYGGVAQALHRLAPESKITGVDTDADKVLWDREHIKFAKFRVLPLLPPTSLLPEQFDLLYGISFLARLKVDQIEAWRDEIHRIVRPGGVILATLNCTASLAMKNSRSTLTQTLSTGQAELAPSGNSAVDNLASSYRHNTYLTPRRAAELLGDRFRVRDIVSLANLNQELVVCERV